MSGGPSRGTGQTGGRRITHRPQLFSDQFQDMVVKRSTSSAVGVYATSSV
ncbi:hypothetical protein SAMN05443432_103389 [Roseovarius litoreus]|uniref:Uncharacterized protein n=1 Tax=Roseovarius litoreus TaxID=1155722 RepID=A0A1M7EJH5_9RHOB|nr:hypothetical protein SAMN05443432_103389 [Roseovarius litoreus]